MENEFINITNEDLEELSFEELADLKIELDDLASKVNDMLKDCDDILNKNS